MKTKYILYLLLGLLVFACSEDKGNYSYTPINDLTISGIQTKDYNFVISDTLRIPVTLTRSLKNTEENLSFSWVFDGKEVATTKDLCISSPEGVSYGKKDCQYVVTDHSNGMKWYKRFTVNVVSSFNWGYYFLTEKEDHSAVISYLPISDSTEMKDIVHTTNIEGVELGKYPVKIIGSYDYGEDCYNAYFMTKEGDMPVMITNTGTFTYGGGANASSFMESDAGYTFSPADLIVDPRNNMYIVSDGKFVPYLEGMLYRPSRNKKDYYWTYSLSWPQMVSCALALDRNTQKFYRVALQETVPEEGIIGDPYSLDKVIEFENSPVYTNETIAGNVGDFAYGEGYAFMDSYITIISCSPGKFYFNKYDFYENYQDGSSEARFLGRQEVSVLGANSNSKALLVGSNCFFTAGNTIYTSPKVQLDAIETFKDIPGYGEIVDIQASAGGTRLLVATYDADSPQPLKGSVFTIDILTKEVTPHPYSVHKCVSILSANTDPQGWGNGDGK